MSPLITTQYDLLSFEELGGFYETHRLAGTRP